MKSAHRRFSYQEAQLLIHSDVLQNFPWLHRLLKETRQLRAPEYSKLSAERRRFVDEMWNVLVTEASHEWVIVDNLYRDIGPDWQVISTSFCELCPRRKLRREWFIRHKRTGKQLLVGSECVNRFQLKSDSGKSLNQIKRKQEKLQRRAELDSMFHDIYHRTTSFRRYIRETPVQIPRRLEEPFVTTGEQVAGLYQQLLKGRVKKGNIDSAHNELRELWTKWNEQYEQILGHIENHQGNEFRPSRKIIRHLESRHSLEARQAIAWLKEDEKITERTLFRITEPDFVRSLVPHWNEALLQFGLRIEDVLDNGPRYLCRVQKLDDLQLTITHSAFSLMCGRFLFEQQNKDTFPWDQLIDRCELHDDDDTILGALERLRHSIGFAGFIIDRIVLERDILILRKSRQKRYHRFAFRSFIKRFKSAVLGASPANKEMSSYLNNEPTISETELKDLQSIAHDVGRISVS